MATMVAPAALVVGAPRIPLPYGLFSLFAPRGNADRWEFGVQWETLTLAPVGGRGAPDLDNGAAVTGLPKDLAADAAPEGNAIPFAVYGHYTCSPIGNSFEYAQDQAVLHLEAREEARVEQALWTGDLGNTPNFAGANGYAAPTSAGTFALADAWRAVGAVEQLLAELYGSQGVIHMSRYLATILFDDGKLEKRGGRLFTPLDTPVVAGTGYGDDKIVGTPALFGYRGDVITGSGTPYDLLDRAANNLYALAEREYLLGFDPGSLVAATITPPA